MGLEDLAEEEVLFFPGQSPSETEVLGLGGEKKGTREGL